MSVTRDADGTLRIGGLSLAQIAREHGTPTYAYDVDAIAAEARELVAAFGAQRHLVAYAVKANAAGTLVRALAAEGCGADVVSGPELLLARAAGIDASKIVYSGVAKSDAELDLAIGCDGQGIGAVQAESVEEIVRIAARAAALGIVARVSLRVNPGIDAEAIDTHAHIATGHDEAKFGIALSDVPRALAAVDASEHVALVGVSCHIGSQLTETGAYLDAARTLFRLARSLRATYKLSFVDTGGGFGIDYGGGCPVRPADFARALVGELVAADLSDLALHVEPGRAMVAAHGVLVSRVVQTKVSGERRWLMIDAGMNDLMRPALYQANHRVVRVDAPSGPERAWRVVGPVCESSDDFGAHALAADGAALVALLDAGAYGYSMASRYNGRPTPAEVFVSGGRVVGALARRDWTEWALERARV